MRVAVDNIQLRRLCICEQRTYSKSNNANNTTRDALSAVDYVRHHVWSLFTQE